MGLWSLTGLHEVEQPHTQSSCYAVHQGIPGTWSVLNVQVPLLLQEQKNKWWNSTTSGTMYTPSSSLVPPPDPPLL